MAIQGHHISSLLQGVPKKQLPKTPLVYYKWHKWEQNGTLICARHKWNSQHVCFRRHVHDWSHLALQVVQDHSPAQALHFPKRHEHDTGGTCLVCTATCEDMFDGRNAGTLLCKLIASQSSRWSRHRCAARAALALPREETLSFVQPHGAEGSSSSQPACAAIR